MVFVELTNLQTRIQTMCGKHGVTKFSGDSMLNGIGSLTCSYDNIVEYTLICSNLA